MANREQMVLVVRYVDEQDDELVIREDPIALLDVLATLRQSGSESEAEVKMSGEKLTKVLLEKTNNLQLDASKLVGQCYDGAASMASAKVGVAAGVKAKAPLADYFHCAVHAVNLSTSLIRKVAVVRNGLDAMESVITFVTDGAKRGDILRLMQAQNLDAAKQHKLVKLCQTRFVERHVAVERFCEQLPAIHHALRAIATWTDDRSSSKAVMLLHSITRTEFLVGVFVAERLASVLRPLALSLQERGAELISAVRSVLQQLRSHSEEEFLPVMAKVEAAARELEVELTKPACSGTIVTPRQRRRRGHQCR